MVGLKSLMQVKKCLRTMSSTQEHRARKKEKGAISLHSKAFVVTEFDRCTGCSAELLLSSIRREPAPLPGRCFRSYLRDPEPVGFWSAGSKDGENLYPFNRFLTGTGSCQIMSQTALQTESQFKQLTRETNLEYKADITAGSLKVSESRVIADLLLQNVSKAEWNAAVMDDNILQTRNPATGKRLARLIRNRLDTMSPELWEMVRDGNALVATHSCLAAAVKHSALLADFLELVVKEQYQIFAKELSGSLWDDFLLGCASRDPSVDLWRKSTIIRLKSSVFYVLEQAGYIEDTKTMRLQTVYISREVVRYLEAHNEDNVLRCIQIAS